MHSIEAKLGQDLAFSLSSTLSKHLMHHPVAAEYLFLLLISQRHMVLQETRYISFLIPFLFTFVQIKDCTCLDRFVGRSASMRHRSCFQEACGANEDACDG